MSALGWKPWLAAKGYDLDAIGEMAGDERDTLLDRLNAEWRAEAETATGSRRREDAIRDAVAKHSAGHTPEKTTELQAIGDRAIAEAWTSKRAELELLRTARSTGPMVMTPRPTAAIDEDIVATAIGLSAGIGESTLLRGGTSPEVMERTRANRQLSGLSLHGLVRHALRSMGEDVTGKINDSHVRRALHPTAEMMASASSIVSVSGILSNLANKALLGSYAMAPAPWRTFAAAKSVSDFKTATAFRPSLSVGAVLLPPGGEVTHGSGEEESYEYHVDTFARQLRIDRRDIVNDDLGMWADTLPAMGRGCMRTLNNLVATTILANASSFWGAANANYFEGAATNLQASSLNTAIQTLRVMKDGEGNFLDLEPAVLLVPAVLEQTARGLLESAELLRTSTDQLPTGNTYRGLAQLCVEPRLGDSSFTGYSATAWWLFSAPSNAAVIVAFLDGAESPTLETFGFDSDIDRLAMGWRVYHDFGCALGDHRASVKSKGAA